MAFANSVLAQVWKGRTGLAWFILSASVQFFGYLLEEAALGGPMSETQAGAAIIGGSLVVGLPLMLGIATLPKRAR